MMHQVDVPKRSINELSCIASTAVKRHVSHWLIASRATTPATTSVGTVRSVGNGKRSTVMLMSMAPGGSTKSSTKSNQKSNQRTRRNDSMTIGTTATRGFLEGHEHDWVPML